VRAYDISSSRLPLIMATNSALPISATMRVPMCLPSRRTVTRSAMPKISSRRWEM
jgi:hypothetical protein